MQVTLYIYNTSIDLCVYAADEKTMDAMVGDIEFTALSSVDTYNKAIRDGAVHFDIKREDIIDLYKFLFDLSLDYIVMIQ